MRLSSRQQNRSPTRHQGCLSEDSLADASLGSDIRLRRAAPTAIWSFSMSFSLRGGGVASRVFGRPSLGRPSFVPFDMSPGLHGGAREKCQLMSMCTRWLLSKFNVVGMHSTERRGLCCMRAFAAYLRADSEGRRDGEAAWGVWLFSMSDSSCKSIGCRFERHRGANVKGVDGVAAAHRTIFARRFTAG